MSADNQRATIDIHIGTEVAIPAEGLVKAPVQALVGIDINLILTRGSQEQEPGFVIVGHLLPSVGIPGGNLDDLSPVQPGTGVIEVSTIIEIESASGAEAVNLTHIGARIIITGRAHHNFRSINGDAGPKAVIFCRRSRYQFP